MGNSIKRRSQFLASIIGLILSSNVYCQWIKASSPNRGAINSLYAMGPALFAGTDSTGAYTSVDGGKTWKSINNGFKSQTITSMIFVGSTIFAGTDSGVYLSIDNGLTWTPRNTGLSRLKIKGLTSIGTDIFSATDSAVYISQDTGKSWTEKAFGLPTQTPGTGSWVSISFLKANGSNLYVSFNGAQTYSSSNSGTSWKKLMIASTGPGSTTGMFIRSLLKSGNNILTGQDGGIYSSNDNGSNWVRTDSALLKNGAFTSIVEMQGNLFALDAILGNLYVSSNASISWKKVFAFSSENKYLTLAVMGTVLFCGNATGDVLASSDQGATWTFTNLGLPSRSRISSFEPMGTKLFAGTNGYGVYVSKDNGSTWTASNGGVPSITVSQFTVVGNNIFAAGKEGVFRSTDSGVTWVKSNSGLGNSGSVNSIARIENRMFVSTNDSGILTSNDFGSSWKPCNKGIVFDTGIALKSGESNLHTRAIAVLGNTLIASDHSVGTISVADANKNWLGDVSTGGLYRSTNLGESWTKSDDPALKSQRIASLSVVESDLYAGAPEGVFLSPDIGQIWEVRNIPAINVPVFGWTHPTPITQIVSNGSNIFSGTNLGFYTSNDKGKTWSLVGGPFGSDSVFSLGKNEQSLFAFTSKGLWRLPIQGTTDIRSIMKPASASKFSRKYRMLYGSEGVSYTLDNPERVQIDIFSSSGKKASSLVDGIQSSGEHTVRIPKNHSPSLYIFRFQIGEDHDSKQLFIE